MKLAIIGYGKMGRLIGQLAPEYGFSIHSALDMNDDLSKAKGADAAIEFSIPSAVVENVSKLAALGVPTVVGTTGWLEHLDAVTKAVETHGTALVWSPNFSVGVNIFFRVVREASKLLAAENEYGAWAWEIHHDTKKDAPSGTMIRLVEEIKQAGYARPIDVISNRAGKHPGTHEIGFDSVADTITLRHAARSRDGFARGALKAAQWIPGKKGVFKFEEVLFEKR